MNILIISFNRPDLIQEKISELIKIKGINLFFHNDGPRIGNAIDELKILEIKSIINERAEFFTQVNFLNSNLGCKNSVETAINWFFTYVDNGIILEDDIFVSQNVLNWMNFMLNKFETDDECFMISAQSISDINLKEHNLYKSYVPFIWGWATWKKKWVLNNNKKNMILLLFYFLYFNYSLKYTFQILITLRQIKNKKIDIWSTNLFATLVYNNMYCITPSVNLVLNKGFSRLDSTHTDIIPNWYYFNIDLANHYINSSYNFNLQFVKPIIFLEKIWDLKQKSIFKIILKYLLWFL